MRKGPALLRPCPGASDAAGQRCARPLALAPRATALAQRPPAARRPWPSGGMQTLVEDAFDALESMLLPAAWAPAWRRSWSPASAPRGRFGAGPQRPAGYISEHPRFPLSWGHIREQWGSAAILVVRGRLRRKRRGPATSCSFPGLTSPSYSPRSVASFQLEPVTDGGGRGSIPASGTASASAMGPTATAVGFGITVESNKMGDETSQETTAGISDRFFGASR